MKDLVIMFVLALMLGSAVNAYRSAPQAPSEPGAVTAPPAQSTEPAPGASESSAGGATVQAVGVTTDATFEQQVLKSDVPVLVDCFATWCGPCKTMEPIIEELADENKGRLKVYKLDVDDNQKTAAMYPSEGIPNFLIFKDGKVVKTIEGARPKEVFVAAIAKVCGNSKNYDVFSSAPTPGKNIPAPEQQAPSNNAVTAKNEDVPLVDETSFDRDVIKSASPVLVFFCDNSDACKRTWPTVVSVADKVFGKYRVVRVDVTSHPALAQEYYVSRTPTFVIFKNGLRYKQLTGVLPERDLLSFLEVQHTASAQGTSTY